MTVAQLTIIHDFIQLSRGEFGPGDTWTKQDEEALDEAYQTLKDELDLA